MSRPLRLEYPGAFYHITSRGNAQADIFLCDNDRDIFVRLLRDEIDQQGWICYAWCLMNNHYHFLIETPEANLSRGMQRLNGRYTQGFNRRHGRVGHVFQGRYKAILVEKEVHLLELCRYIVLNPVRAGMVNEVSQWEWSSYQQTSSMGGGQQWVATDQVLGLFSDQAEVGMEMYRQFVADGVADRPWKKLRGQIFLGNEDFLSRNQAMLSRKASNASISLAQLHPTRPTSMQVLKDLAKAYSLEPQQVLDRRVNRDAYRLGVFLLRRVCNMSLKEVADLASISPARVSQIQLETGYDQLPDSLSNYNPDPASARTYIAEAVDSSGLLKKHASPIR